MADFNTPIIEAFRANGGLVREPMDFGRGLVLVHVPRRDGSEHVVPLAALKNEHGWHVVGTAAGSPKDPAWAHSLRRAERTTIEVPADPDAGDEDIRTVPVTVSEVTGPERDELWQGFVAQSPAFAGYERTANGRVFPVFRFVES